MVIDLGPWFTAQFTSECAECPQFITAGSRARYKNNEIVCTSCGENETSRWTPEVICSVCFLTLSTSDVRNGRTTHQECE